MKTSKLNRILSLKLLWLIIPLIVGLLLIPSAFSFASEDEETFADEAENSISIKGTVLDSQGKGFTTKDKAYAIAIGYLTNTQKYYESKPATPKLKTGEFTITGIPNDFEGIVIASALKHSAQAKIIKNSPDAKIDFNPRLFEGVDCRFANAKEVQYFIIKTGSTITTGNDTLSIPFDLNVPVSDRAYGIRTHSTLTGNLEKGTIAYKHVGEGQSINLSIGVRPIEDKVQELSYWSLNDIVSFGTTDITEDYIKAILEPHFTKIGEMDVGGEILDASGAPLTANDGAYAMILGYRFGTGGLYVSEKVAPLDQKGSFKITGVPNNVVGLVFAGAKGHTNQAKLVMYDAQLSSFQLNPGAQCTINMQEECKTTLLKAGSYITVTILGEQHVISLDEDVDLGNDFPPIGIPFNGATITLNDDGTAVYKLQRDASNAEDMELTFQAVGQEGKTFHGWLKNGEDFSGSYTPSAQDGDFTIEANFKDPVIPPVPTPPSPEYVSPQTGDSTGITMILIFLLCMLGAASISLKSKNLNV